MIISSWYWVEIYIYICFSSLVSSCIMPVHMMMWTLLSGGLARIVHRSDFKLPTWTSRSLKHLFYSLAIYFVISPMKCGSTSCKELRIKGRNRINTKSEILNPPIVAPVLWLGILQKSDGLCSVWHSVCISELHFFIAFQVEWGSAISILIVGRLRTKLL